MSCLINTGLTKNECNFLIGGIKYIYLANYSQVTSFNDGASDGIFDTVTMSSTSGKFYLFETSKNTSFYSQVLTSNGDNKYVLQSVDFTVAKADNTAREVADKLALGKFIVVVETRNGSKVVLGTDNGLEASAGEFSSGTAEGDNSGIKFVLTGPSLGYAHEFIGTLPV